jgi:hydroxyacyl-ACP dehydratase HTD2-like protein with hotdog domain
MTDLAEALAGWAPEPAETTETIMAGPAVGLAGLLDGEPPGDLLPPLWHWLYFLDRPAQSELGPDGHRATGPFVPPVPGLRRMHAGGRITYQAPVQCCYDINRRSELAGWKIRQGRSGELLFVTLRHSFSHEGTPVLTEEQDLVYRRGPAPGGAAEPAPADPGFPWRMPVTADPVLLFRFSALTYNSHRIHYDAAYATAVEGHPGLVVQGPLQAILCLELLRRHLPGRAVAELTFRARSPLYAGDLFVVAGGLSGTGTCELRVTGPGGHEAMTVTVHLRGT